MAFYFVNDGTVDVAVSFEDDLGAQYAEYWRRLSAIYAVDGIAGSYPNISGGVELLQPYSQQYVDTIEVNYANRLLAYQLEVPYWDSGDTAIANVDGVTATSQGQTSDITGAFASASGIVGTLVSLQAQTSDAMGTANPASVSGTVATTEGQTTSIAGSASPATVSGTNSTAQAQTNALLGNASPAVVSGVNATSQGQLVTGTGSHIDPAGGVSGTGNTSQGQSTSGAGSVANPEIVVKNEWYGYLTSYELLNRKKKRKEYRETPETLEETLAEIPQLAPIEIPNEAKKLLRTIKKKAERDGKAAADAFVDRLIAENAVRINALNKAKQIEIQQLIWLENEDEEEALLLLF